MGTDSLRKRCTVNTNFEEDTFVGVQCLNDNIQVSFPLGFELSNSDGDLRKEILLLLDTIRIHTGKRESVVSDTSSEEFDDVALPIQSYLFVIYDYYSRGYYKEKETQHIIAKRGKIDWNRTIKRCTPKIQDDDVFYLDFDVRRNEIRENELITLIHAYCVFESFRKLGWLFTAFLPPKPSIKYNYSMFKTVVLEKLSRTFDDRNKQLFQNMLSIIESKSDPDADNSFHYGTYRFEYVWESIIDTVFGEPNKENYFPISHWSTVTGDCDNAPLEPDTIMITGDKIFVLDAKYYKYGMTGVPLHLPASSSINKQITYGEYVEQMGYHADKIYNAFLMPYNSAKNKFHSSNEYLHIGEATGNWRGGKKRYEHIQGIVIDVKHLMQVMQRKNPSEILKLAASIENIVNND